MSDTQRELYAAVLEQIHHNLSILTPGMSFWEINEKSWHVPERYRACRYSVALHGVGLADEYPWVPLHEDFAEAYDGRLEENMTVCVESLIGEQGGRECVSSKRRWSSRPMAPPGSTRFRGRRHVSVGGELSDDRARFPDILADVVSLGLQGMDGTAKSL